MQTEDVASRDGIPLTAPARTLVDLATELSPIAVERAVNEADKRDLIDPEALRAALDSYEGEPGAPLLRELLDKRTSASQTRIWRSSFVRSPPERVFQFRSANKSSMDGKSTSTGPIWASW
jgi:hypothetical protein